eukprot:TRINITY_DN10805_c0_g1_i7.p1 TRINITY_DN10805_c0_g1~~TRINITY_DN10805_c0_g1_i7.p1  ORF type:complete len:170 (-),score=16.97 TRINITY_DN10805_c0_g1_i7:162-671(-)
MQPAPNPYPTLGQISHVPLPFPQQSYMPLRQAPGIPSPVRTAPNQSFPPNYSPVSLNTEQREPVPVHFPHPQNERADGGSVRVIKLPENFALTPGCGRKSAFAMCPNCRHQGMTAVASKSGNRTYAVALALCCVFWPLACVPCHVAQCKYVVHSCAKCGHVISQSPPFE